MGRRNRWAAVILIAGACGSCGGGGGGGGPAFVAGPDSALGAMIPLAVGLGYVDGDGRRDLVVGGGVPAALGFVTEARAYLGREGGTFDARAPIEVGVPPVFETNRLLPGHFDDGADLDFVIVSGSEYGVLLGRGDGTFDAAMPHVGVFPGGLVALDAAVIRGDGNFRDDLVVGTGDGSIVFLLADGTGGFQVSDVIAATPGRSIWQLVVADMNEDDIDDVVVLDDHGGVTVFFGDHAGSLDFGSAIAVGLPGEAKGILVGNFDDADGLDLAVMRGPFTQPSLHSWVMTVTGDGAGGFGIIDGTADLPGLDWGYLARGALLNTWNWRSEFAIAAGPGPLEDRSLHLVRTDAAGQPTVEAIPGTEGVFVFASADMDDDGLADLVTVSLDSETAGATVRILYRSPP